MINQLNISDQIQLVSATVSTLIAVISIIIAIATLRQTNKITEEANRPYLAIYLETVQVTSAVVTYIVLKNFGSTGALIDSITYESEGVSKYGIDSLIKLSNHFIAPNQAISSGCYFEKPYMPFTFTLKYSNGKKKYSEKFIVNPDAISELQFSKALISSSDNLMSVISKSAQEIIRSQF